MSEYWKSNPRKFCDFCKCWIAENKPSIEFHERGKRHKENVQKKLEEIGKKGKEDYENKLKEEDYMKEMEEAALQAYKKDLEQNPDVTGMKIVGMAEASNAKIVISGKSVETWMKEAKEKKPIPIKPQPKWQEAKNPEGFSYYWHTETGESVWEPPKEGYVSLEDSKPKNQEQSETKSKSKKEKASKKSGNSNSKTSKKKEKEIKVSKEAEETPKPSSTEIYGPMPSGNPYGNWESTFQPVVNEIDLQLPSVPEPEYYAPEVITRRPELKFEEKIVTLSKEKKVSGPISFKKRKGGEESKKNVRRRVDD